TVHAVDTNNALIKIRMMGIDAPESHLITDHGSVGQFPWGPEASDSLKKMLKVGDRIEIEDFGKDKYGRTLGHLVLNGQNINIEQVARGQAITYVICDRGHCTQKNLEEGHTSELVAACRAAEKAGLGVFSPARPLQEMPFEFRLRMQNRMADKFVGNMATKEYFGPDRYKEVPVCDRIFFMSEADAKNLGYTRR
ncbi:MAG: thermonuclease family protein, partial [Bdellovibrionales bacterium]|nr:thermonuclease family protein [Bdellovibrionales bacterium]